MAGNFDSHLTSVDIADFVAKYKDDLPAPESLDTERELYTTGVQCSAAHLKKLQT